MPKDLLDTVQFVKSVPSGCERIFSDEAVNFLIKLHHKFSKEIKERLNFRHEMQKKIDQGYSPDFLTETAHIRDDKSWKVAKTPKDLERRWVEITGPTDKKMVINALNSGADVFMADFEDSNSPTWTNVVEGQKNLIDAIQKTLSFSSPEGKSYKLNEKTAVLLVRPRGLHLFEEHFLVHGEPISGPLFDFGLYFFHNAKALLKKNTAPYFYLPKMENHLEARLWNDIFTFAQKELNVPQGTIRATVLIETILAAFEMEEILFELKEHMSGLNAGRWDYIFSIIKKFSNREDFVFPDRAQITMTVPFMRAYTELLVKTCHAREAHAMGGMAAFVPSRKDTSINEMAFRRVKEDKLRESKDGFDGTWVAHPDLCALAREVFQNALKNKENQVERKREEVKVSAKDLLNFNIKDAEVTEAGVRNNINVSLQYLTSWLMGVGAAAIFNLMEDVATAEIARSQLWQWVHSPKAVLKNGQRIDENFYKQLASKEVSALKKLFEKIPNHRLDDAKKLLDHLVLSPTFVEFLTIDAYKLIK